MATRTDRAPRAEQPGYRMEELGDRVAGERPTSSAGASRRPVANVLLYGEDAAAPASPKNHLLSSGPAQEFDLRSGSLQPSP